MAHQDSFRDNGGQSKISHTNHYFKLVYLSSFSYISRKLSYRVMLKCCFSYSSHRDEQNEWQQAYVWMKNNEVGIMTILTPFDPIKVRVGT